MKIATAAEMRAIDHCAVTDYSIPSIVLMENAGIETAKAVEELFDTVMDKKVIILAGKGNNGGDGFAAARHLSNQGAKVKIFLLGCGSQKEGDAAVHYQIAVKMQIDMIQIHDERDWDKFKIAASFAHCLVDALLGTGLKGNVRDDVQRLIRMINAADRPVVAVDIPSGLHADTGQAAAGVAVRATRTITFGLPKPGLLLYPGALFAGELLVSDIGLPQRLLRAETLSHNVVTARLASSLLPKRAPDSHKGLCGKVLVVAGSQGMTGAAALASNGALRGGAGLVTLAVAQGLHDIMESKLTEVMTTPLPQVEHGVLGPAALELIVELAAHCQVVAIGPGLGRHEQTAALVRELIVAIDKPLVIDADALHALACTGADILTQAQTLPVLTPHVGELARLLGVTVDDIKAGSIEAARQAAELFGSIVVLKGARSIVAYPDGEVYINVSGNAGMATGGTGDVLTGAIAALIAQGLSCHDAAVAGVYIHGLAGDIAAEGGQIGLTASDVLYALPAAIMGLQK